MHSSKTYIFRSQKVYHDITLKYGKPFYYLFYKSDIWFNISDIIYNI